MTTEWHIGFAALFAAVLAFLSTIESAVGELSEVQLRVFVAEHEGGFHGRLVKELVESPQRLRLNLSFASQTLVVSITLVILQLLDHWPVTQAYATAWTLLMMLGVVGLFRQLIPRLLVQRNPERTLLFLLPALSVIYRALHPITYPMYRVIQSRREKLEQEEESVEKEEEDTDEEIQAFIDVGEEEGIIEEAEGELIQSIVELAERRVVELMTPRSDIVAIPCEMTVREALDAIIDSKYTRVPVYRGQLDNIEGVVYIRDILKCWRAGREHESVGSVARVTYFVPETKLAGDLLEEMRRSRTHIALVVDEFGGIAGLVTIEDLLEQIVGEIQSEEGSEEDIVQQPDGSFLVKGTAEIRKIENLFDMEIEADDYTTVAGLIIRHLKRLPSVGERLQSKGLLFEIVEADRRRIRKVRLRRLQAAAADSPDSAL
jgi:CBS domain containing-hemolysin-like protein